MTRTTEALLAKLEARPDHNQRAAKALGEQDDAYFRRLSEVTLAT